ncbi:MAG: NAD(P)-dependent alcohol dehydrogenase [Rhodospirillales bacterium]|nr:NAD(P)-dependent alcohol dehydrogenase [Rhodospirillales bacterium]
MRVWEIKEEFGRKNLVMDERADPAPGPGQVKLRMLAASINFRDLVVIEGQYGRHITPPLIPLSDGVGEVVAVGEGVARVSVGDRVTPLFFQGWLAGEPRADLMAPTTTGGPLDGVLAEYMTLDQQSVAPVPEHLSDGEASTLPCAALTAWSALVTWGAVKPGEIVVIQGTGGVSLFALQFARMLGAETIVTSSSDEKLVRARELGADHTVNYRTTPDWDRAVKTLIAGRGLDGVDHVVEVGGAETLARSVRCVRVGGTISLIGVLSGAKGGFDLPLILMRNVRVQGVTVGSREGHEAMVRAIDSHRLKPVVDRVFAFEEFPAALDYLASGSHFGKVCVRIAGG